MTKILSTELENDIDLTGGVSTQDPLVANELTRKSYVNAQDDLRILLTEKGAVNGVATLDANSLIPITQIPPSALERLVVVADQAARFALTLATVQNGDTVSQTDTDEMFFVKDDTNLNSALGYQIYSAGTASAVAWSGVTGTPTTLAGYGITDAVLASDLASTANLKGASTVGVEDTAGNFTGTEVESVLAELYTAVGAAGKIPEKYPKTIDAPTIAATFFDLPHEAFNNIVDVNVVGGLLQIEGTDYTISVVSNVTRITLLGDLLELKNVVVAYTR